MDKEYLNSECLLTNHTGWYMKRIVIAKVLMTFVLMGGSVLSFVLDWSPNHLLNPLWHPHARFHGALLLFLLAGVSVTATWLLWRRSKEPEIAFVVAAAISAAYWTPLFYIPLILPSSTWWAGRAGAEPHLDGMVFYPNLAVAGMFLLMTGVAYRLAKIGLADTQSLVR
jgi:cation transport ATPase